MAVEVRIPTILRTYTDEQKAVTAEGATLAAVIDDLEANHPGIKDRLVEDGPDKRQGLRRFVNVYVNDEDVRFIGGLDAEVSDGDQVVVLPAVAGGAHPTKSLASPASLLRLRTPRGPRAAGPVDLLR